MKLAEDDGRGGRRGRSIPIMGENYPAAAVRHFKDGSLLDDHGRLDNADQLFGLAAECGIKAALAPLLRRSSDSSPAKLLRMHVNELWEQVPLTRLQRSHPGLFAALKCFPTPFQDWAIEQRYWSDKSVSREDVTAHRKAAKRVLGAVRLLGTRREG